MVFSSVFGVEHGIAGGALGGHELGIELAQFMLEPFFTPAFLFGSFEQRLAFLPVLLVDGLQSRFDSGGNSAIIDVRALISHGASQAGKRWRQRR